MDSIETDPKRQFNRPPVRCQESIDIIAIAMS